MNARYALATAFSLVILGTAARAQVAFVSGPDTTAKNPNYVANREPLTANPLIKLPIRSVEPRGWIRKQLELEAQGFTGHLGEISKFLAKKGNSWLEPAGGDHGWEEVPYWLKGYINLAFLLRDEAMIAESKTWIDAAIRSQLEDGWFGPQSNRTRIQGKADLWPNMIMLFCLQDYYDYTADPRVTELMTRYFRYLTTIPEQDFFPDYWDKMRGGDLLSSVYWLYNLKGDAWLLDLAGKVHRKTARWDQDVVNLHNVNFAQAFGEPTTYWLQSKDAAHRQASYRNYDKMRDLYGQVPGALYGADENARPGKDDPRQGVETCGMVEFMLSTERLTWITGDLLWADRCEDVAFNMLPAALTADLKALRYFTAPNLAVSDRKNHAPGFENDGAMLDMNPHSHRCCQHNWAHGWPYYAEHLYFATPDRGLAAILYSESKVEAKVGEGSAITLEQQTHYPFSDEVRIRVHAEKPVRFPLYLRVPAWCSKPAVAICGKPEKIAGEAKSFVRLDREWSDGDEVVLTLPMEIRLRQWTKNHNSISVDRGPLTYSLKIGEKYERAGGTDQWPAWEILPTTPWNYGLVLGKDNLPANMEVVAKQWPSNNMPFTQEGAPLEIRAHGKRIPEWKLDQYGLVAELQDSPVASEQPDESIVLIPMGAARLRISSFPVIGQGDSARVWKP